MSSSRILYGVVALSLFVVEVFIATRLPHLNWVRGSLGDILVVALLYAFALAIRDFDRPRLAAATFFFACAIESCQYFRLAQRLDLKPNGVLWTTLGSTATWEDILCYLAGAILALAGDLAILGGLAVWSGRSSRTRRSTTP